MVGIRAHPDGLCLRCHERAQREARRQDQPERTLLRRVDETEDMQPGSLRDERPPVRLVALLRRDRAGYWGAPLSFEEAWPDSVEAAVYGLDEHEANAWRAVFRSTIGAWRDSYNRTPSPLASFTVESLLGGGREHTSRDELVA